MRCVVVCVALPSAQRLSLLRVRSLEVSRSRSLHKIFIRDAVSTVQPSRRVARILVRVHKDRAALLSARDPPLIEARVTL